MDMLGFYTLRGCSGSRRAFFGRITACRRRPRGLLLASPTQPLFFNRALFRSQALAPRAVSLKHLPGLQFHDRLYTLRHAVNPARRRRLAADSKCARNQAA